jgi:hypothetical protein
MIKNTLKEVEMPALDVDGKGLSVLICSDYTFQFNWMTYACWYSVSRNLPEAKIAIVSPRPKKITNYLYHWVYKILDLRYHLHKNFGERYQLPYLNKIYGVYLALKEGLVKQPLVVLEADMMAVSDFSNSTLEKLSQVTFATNSCSFSVPFDSNPIGSVWYLNGVSLEQLAITINTLGLGKDRSHLDLLALSRVFGKESVVIEDLCNEAHRHEATTFAHYKERCGNFSRADWEKGKIVPPFNVSYALQTSDLSVNERKILSLWHQMATLYEAVNQIKV